MSPLQAYFFYAYISGIFRYFPPTCVLDIVSYSKYIKFFALCFVFETAWS